MFLKTNAIAEVVTSGSTVTGQVIDVSGYSRLWLESAVSGAIAGTGSLYITSISQADTAVSGNQLLPDFSIQTPIATLTGNGGSGWSYSRSIVLGIDAKWALVKFTETSGSAAGTGSVLIKCSLLSGVG